MNIYKEFKKQNPGIKAIAKAAALKGDTANGYAGCLLADKAEQTAKACADLGKFEKAIYYYSKAYNWYANAGNPKAKSIHEEIIETAKIFIPPKC
jgi:tetratricopeptide (TPR) repeat protein